MLNLLNEKDEKGGYKHQSEKKSDDSLGHGELWLFHIRFAIGVSMLIHLNDLVKDAVLAAGLVPDVHEECNDQCNRGRLADAHNIFFGLNDGNEISFISIVVGALILVLCEENDEKNDFNDGSKGRLNENTSYLGHLSRKFLSSKAEQIGCRDDSDVGGSELPEMHAREELEDDGDGDDRPQDVHPHGRGA
ncbi:hypothetical protein HG531_009569 [Fusarium graminearum]|nr:hypothetical protein HG531_009569 [Fusarium graminearum]